MTFPDWQGYSMFPGAQCRSGSVFRINGRPLSCKMKPGAREGRPGNPSCPVRTDCPGKTRHDPQPAAWEMSMRSISRAVGVPITAVTKPLARARTAGHGEAVQHVRTGCIRCDAIWPFRPAGAVNVAGARRIPGMPEPDHADVDVPVHAADQRVRQEGRGLYPHARPLLRPLQPCTHSFPASGHPRQWRPA